MVYLSLAPNAALKHGLFAQGSVQLGSQLALAVPLSAVRTDKPAPYVQWVNQGRVVHRTVVLGERGDVKGSPYVALQGVEVGTRVLAGTLGQLREGISVRMDMPPGNPKPTSDANVNVKPAMAAAGK